MPFVEAFPGTCRVRSRLRYAPTLAVHLGGYRSSPRTFTVGVSHFVNRSSLVPPRETDRVRWLSLREVRA